MNDDTPSLDTARPPEGLSMDTEILWFARKTLRDGFGYLPGMTRWRRWVDEVKRMRDLLDMATSYEVSPPTVTARMVGPVLVERVGQLDGPDLWAVRQRGNVLGRDGHWTYEPIPSSRDDEFFAMYRFPGRDEAMAAARVAIMANE